jgi:hypothetical protein
VASRGGCPRWTSAVGAQENRDRPPWRRLLFDAPRLYKYGSGVRVHKGEFLYREGSEEYNRLSDKMVLIFQTIILSYNVM